MFLHSVLGGLTKEACFSHRIKHLKR